MHLRKKMYQTKVWSRMALSICLHALFYLHVFVAHLKSFPKHCNKIFLHQAFFELQDLKEFQDLDKWYTKYLVSYSRFSIILYVYTWNNETNHNWCKEKNVNLQLIFRNFSYCVRDRLNIYLYLSLHNDIPRVHTRISRDAAYYIVDTQAS